jgi:hypothetical protein
MTTDTPQSNPITQLIALLNDQARKAMGLASKVHLTQGFLSLPEGDQWAIREAVEKYDDFTPDNDPYGERDFGIIRHKGHTVYWKIDYYDRTMTQGSENPADGYRTIRVLTLMLAEEY